MRGWAIVLATAGCTAEGPRPGSSASPTEGCTPLDDLAVASVVALPGNPDTMVTLDVTLTSAATVAAACVADTEPDQVFFAESTVPSEVHTLRMSGLLPDLSYTCSVAPTCPTQVAPAETLTWQTSSPPQPVHPFLMVVDPLLGMTGAWTLAPYAVTQGAEDVWIVIWGPDGRVRWWTALPAGVYMSVEALYDLDEQAIVWGGGKSPEGRIRIHDLWEGERYAWAPEGWEDVTFHHDGKRIADGRLMTLENRIDTAPSGDTWEGFGIRVHDPATGHVDFDFDSQTFVDQGILETPIDPDDNDVYHANWIDWHESADGPRVYVSLCTSEQILAIDGATGEVDWLLGKNLGWTVLDAAGTEVPEDALPDCQHGLEVLGDDHFLVYDNGLYESSSFAQEWKVDPVAKTAQRTWSWTEEGWSEWWLGDIDDLGNGRVLLTQGPGPIVEVDRATGLVASRMVMEAAGATYRAERYDGCAFFTSVADCPDLAARYDAVKAVLVLD